jgi:hypothetical protein
MAGRRRLYKRVRQYKPVITPEVNRACAVRLPLPAARAVR